MERRVLSILVAVFAGGFFLVNVVWAANTGKIAGQVVDKATGDPLSGANVVVEGTDLGAATDSRGRFNILQVPPGNYSVQASYIGYHSLTITEVEVRTDLTTRLTFEMESEAIESPTVTVVAEQKMVQQDITSSRRSISESEIQSMPGVENVSDVLRSQAGMVMTEARPVELGAGTQLETRDPSLTGINVRGSRGSDVLILIDGIPATSPVYGGFDIMDLNQEDIRSIEVITGAFSAEYGKTQSAVINITTRSGGADYQGSLEYRSDELGLFGPSYDKRRFAFRLSGPEPITNNLLDGIGAKLPGTLRFFSTVTLDQTNTPYNNQRTRDQLLGLPLEQWGMAAEPVSFLQERQSNKGNVNLKLTYKPTKQIQAIATLRSSWRTWTEFNWLWKNIPNHTADRNRNNQQISIILNHTLSQNTYYKVSLSRTNTRYQKTLGERRPPDFWVITPDTNYSAFESPEKNPLTGFFARGYETDWIHNNNSRYALDLDFTSQVHPEHLIQSGISVDYMDLYNVNIHNGGIALSPYGRYLYRNGEAYPEPVGPYPEFGGTRWVVDGAPKSGALYLTDKFEKESLVINAGLRWDWFMPGPPTTEDPWKEQWETATGLRSDWARLHSQLDPRLGVSFPISTKTSIFFSYGHFNNRPGIQNYIRDPYSGGFTGNPHLEFVKTVKYEFGFTHEFPGKIAMDIKNYTKKTSGQVGTTQLSAEYGLPIHLHDNKGYSRVRGLEFELRKQTRRLLGGRITYNLQWANGYSSSGFEDYQRSLNNLPNPIRERRLDWDIRHQVVLNGNINVRKGRNPEIFGVKLPADWRITFLSTFTSGRPYTPGAHDPVVRRKLHNTQTKPPEFRTDLKLEKGFTVQGYDLTLGLDIDNLFNQYNVKWKGFNNWTGEPYKYGDRIQDTHQIYDYYEMKQLLQPDRFGTGRHVELLLRISW